jgi:hypothetical protein
VPKNFSLELGAAVARITCEHCGRPFESVNGYVKKEGWAYSVYFATLQTGHQDVMVGLTVSIGKFWDDSAIDQRRWVYFRVWPSESGNGFEMRIEEPRASRHVGSPPLGREMSCDEARSSPLLDDFFAVAAFVIDNDPAVLSYLSGRETNTEGRADKR